MSLSVDGVWKAGVWAQTVWADGVWREGAFTPPVVTPPGSGAGGLAGRKPRYRFLGAPSYEPERKIVRVTLEEETPRGVEYKEVEWKPDASWEALDAAISAIMSELGNFDGSLKKSELLKAELKRLKNKRNLRIIMMAIE